MKKQTPNRNKEIRVSLEDVVILSGVQFYKEMKLIPRLKGSQPDYPDIDGASHIIIVRSGGKGTDARVDKVLNTMIPIRFNSNTTKRPVLFEARKSPQPKTLTQRFPWLLEKFQLSFPHS
jgi:hypothetical protein